MSKEKSNKKVKMTLLLDDESLNLIREYGKEYVGSSSVSGSIRAMAKEYGRRKKQNKQNL